MYAPLFLFACSIFLAAPAFAQGAATGERPPVEEMQRVANVFSMLKSDLVVEPDSRGLLRNAIKGMIRTTDPQGDYLDAEELEALKRGLTAREASAGLELRAIHGQILLYPVAGGPAVEAGVHPGDALHAIDGRRTANLTLQEMTVRVRGPEGSKVTLTVFRESTLTVETIAVERKAFVAAKPTLLRAANGAAVLRIHQFQGATLQQASDLLFSAWRQQPFPAVVLDLRGTLGGLSTTAIGLAAMFLPKDSVVAQMRGRTAELSFVHRAAPEFYVDRNAEDPLRRLPVELRALPVAVLVDGATASSAEIVAAALQEHKRAILVGQRTFGRGTVQTVRPMPPSSEAIKYTTAYWTSPGGTRFHGTGLQPDIEIPLSASAAIVDDTARLLLAR